MHYLIENRIFCPKFYFARQIFALFLREIHILHRIFAQKFTCYVEFLYLFLPEIRILRQIFYVFSTNLKSKLNTEKHYAILNFKPKFHKLPGLCACVGVITIMDFSRNSIAIGSLTLFLPFLIMISSVPI